MEAVVVVVAAAMVAVVGFQQTIPAVVLHQIPTTATMSVVVMHL